MTISTAWWSEVNGPDLSQGEYLPSCLVPIVPDDFGRTTERSDLRTQPTNLMVVTQSCDLANMKAGSVALCPASTVPAFEAAHLSFAKKGVWEEVRKGRREGLYLLASPTNPTVSRDAFVVDFREIYSLPIGYLQRHAASLSGRWRLQSPFLEHFSQAFARFFMRVGLPSMIPPFTD